MNAESCFRKRQGAPAQRQVGKIPGTAIEMPKGNSKNDMAYGKLI